MPIPSSSTASTIWPPVHADRQGDGPLGPVAQGVVHQDEHELLQAIALAEHAGLVEVDDLEALRRLRVELAEDLHDDLVELHRLRHQRLRAGVGTDEHEEVVDETGEAA